jgi:hypothetical protein
VWRQNWTNDGRFKVIANRYDSTLGVWEGAVPIDNSPNANVYMPKVVTPGAGPAQNSVMVVWRQHDPTFTTFVRYDLWYNLYTPGLGWGGPLNSVETTAATVYDFDIAINGNGNMSVVWQEDPTGGSSGNIRGNRYNFATITWETNQPSNLLEPFTAAAFDPVVDMASNSEIAMGVWAQSGNIYSNRSLTGNWGAGDDLNWQQLETAGSSTNPQLVVFAAADTAFAAWDQSTCEVRYNFHDGTGWATAQSIDTNFTCMRLRSVVEDSVDGNAFVLFDGTNVDGTTGLWMKQFFSGGSWVGSAQLVSNPALGAQPQAATTIKADIAEIGGATVAVWTQAQNGGMSVWGNSYNPFIGQWGVPRLLEISNNVAPSISGLDVVVDGSGVATVVWNQGVWATMSDQSVVLVSSIFANRLQ